MTAPATRVGRPLPGIVVAGLTAIISGVSVFVNSQGVHAISPPSVYTTAKNLVAAAVLVGFTVAAAMRRESPVLDRWMAAPVTGSGGLGRGTRSRVTVWLGVAYVGIVGGGIAFVLFFQGLASTAATPAAFLHDGLVVWVAFLAVPLLHERLRIENVVAIVLLVGGQVAVLGGVGHLAFSHGEILVLVATWLWAIEVIVCKRLLSTLAPATVSLVRMLMGSGVLLGFVVLTGHLGELGQLSLSQLGWVAATGLLLAGYVGTWMTALSRARAVDVTSVLVGSTVITGLLSAMSGTMPVAPAITGFVLILLGVVILLRSGVRRVAA